MTITTPNLPELKRLNMWVQEQDQLEPGASIWYQGAWVVAREESPMCQSAYCVAGMAVTRAGHKLVSETYIEECNCGDPTCSWENSRMTLDDGETDSYEISRLAAGLLGIDADTAEILFYSGNSAADVDRHIRYIFVQADADYDTTEAAPNFEIEIKAAEVEINAAEAARTHMKFYTNA